MNDFVDNWGEETLGPLAELVLPSARADDEDDNGDGFADDGEDDEGLSELWPRLSRICEGMEDLEASRTKVELARQLAVDRSNPESISHALDKVEWMCILRPLLLFALGGLCYVIYRQEGGGRSGGG